MKKIDEMLDKVIQYAQETKDLIGNNRENPDAETNPFVDIQDVREILEEKLESQDATPLSDVITALRKRGYFKGVSNTDVNKSLSNQLSRVNNIFNHTSEGSQGWSLLPPATPNSDFLGKEKLAFAAEVVVEELAKQQWGSDDLDRIYKHIKMGARGIPAEYDRRMLGIARSTYGRYLSPTERDTLREEVRKEVEKRIERGVT